MIVIEIYINVAMETTLHFFLNILQTLHAKYTIQLLLETRKILKTQANIRFATTSLSKQITVCGDLHGKLSDLYMIFHKVNIYIVKMLVNSRDDTL